jgi:hypothetical protein
MRERLKNLGGQNAPELLEGLVGTALVLLLAADYTAFISPLPTNLWIAQSLTAVFLVVVAGTTGYVFTATETVPAEAHGRRKRFGRRDRVISVSALVLAAGLTGVLFRESATHAVPDIPIYLFNASAQTFVVSANSEFLVDATTLPANSVEPTRGSMQLLTDRRSGIAGTDIIVGPGTSLTLFGRILGPDQYRRTFEAGKAQITIFIEVKSPTIGAKLPTNKCVFRDVTSPHPPCALHL